MENKLIEIQSEMILWRDSRATSSRNNYYAMSASLPLPPSGSPRLAHSNSAPIDPSFF